MRWVRRFALWLLREELEHRQGYTDSLERQVRDLTDRLAKAYLWGEDVDDAAETPAAIGILPVDLNKVMADLDAWLARTSYKEI